MLFRAKDLAEESNNYGLMAKIYGSLAHQYMQLNLDDNAKKYLDKAIEQINKMPEGDDKKLFKGLSYLDLGNITFDEKKFADANLYYKKIPEGISVGKIIEKYSCLSLQTFFV